MNQEIQIIYANEKYLESFHKLLGEVAKERIYIEMVEAPPIESTNAFQKRLIEQNAHVAEVTTQLVPRTLAILLHGLPSECLEKAVTSMPPIKRREIESLFSEQSPSPGEVEAARIKLLSKVRELEDSGRLNLAQIDPAVSIRNVKVA